MAHKNKYCFDCRRNTSHVKDYHNPYWGLLLSILTCGIWIPFWLLWNLAAMTQTWRCECCARRRY